MTNTTKKFATGTKKEMYNRLISLVEKSDDQYKTELIDRLKNEIELITRKSKVSPEKIEKDNALTQAVLDTLHHHKRPMTVSDIQNSNSALSLAEGVSNSKVTSILTKLKNDNRVDRIKENGKSFYVIM
jgi:DNA-binding transcriptional regulator GbsR (MarR family)